MIEEENLSPILFAMVMDVLSTLIEGEVRMEPPPLSYLMYVDDSFFSKANPKSLKPSCPSKGIHLFSILEVNTQKSTVTFSKVCEDNSELHNILSFPHWKPLDTGKKKSFNKCWKLIQPIKNILSRWSGKCLSNN